MTGPFDAVKAALEPLGYPVVIDYNPGVTDATGKNTVAPPYLIVGGPGDGRSDEEPLSGDIKDSNSDMRITAVLGTPEGARIALGRVLGILSPGKQWATIAPGVMTRWTRRETVDVDMSVIITGTNRNPCYGVDTYQLITEGI